jgi:VanZ family protein
MLSLRLFFLLGALVCSAILAYANAIAIAEYLYWKYVWFDILMHFLGGFVLGLFAVGLLDKFRPVLFFGFVTALCIGWEVFEYYFGLPREANYAFDTALDLLMDALGALIAYMIARLTIWRLP